MSGNVRPLHPGMTVTPTPHKKPKLDHDSGDVGVEPDEEESHTYVPPLPTVLPAPSSQCQKAVEPSPPLQPETVETIISATTPTTTTPSTTTSKPKYNRKNKSLGILAESFLAKFAGSEECREIVIDQLAYELAVERRRIYDVVNILEALQVVVKMGKNTYHWMGREHLSRQFALLQNEGFELWPDFAESRGLVVPDHTTNNNINHPAVPMPDNSTHTTVSPKQVSPSSVNNNKENTCTNNNNNKSLTRLSQLFLQVFLVGLDPVNLPQASDLIHGGRSTPDELVSLGMKLGDDYPTDAKKFKQAAARGLKTKIRRLYDIANVFVSVGLLRKSENRTAATTDGKRPHFHWNYGLDVRQIRAIWDMLPLPMKNEKSPFNEAQARMLNTDGNCKTNFFGVYVPPPPTSSVGSSSSKASAMSCLNEFLQGNGTEQRAVATTTGLLPPASDDSSTSQDEQAEACSPSVDDDEGNPSHRSDTFLRRVSLPPTRADWK